MKLFIDLFPLIVFFLVFKYFTNQDFAAATLALMIATVIQMSVNWIIFRKIEKMHIFVLVMVLLFGGMTVLFDDPTFLKWKVTIVEWLFAIALLSSQFIGKQNFIERFMSQFFEAPKSVWLKLNLAWVSFFTLMGFANLYVAFNYSLDTWVDFKVIWMTVITFVFMIASSLTLTRYFKDPEQEQDAAALSKDSNETITVKEDM